MKTYKFLTIVLITLICLFFWNNIKQSTAQNIKTMPSLLTDPFLQLPTETSINVVWFTEFIGDNHGVLYGDKLEKKATATTTKLTRVREDEKSNLEPKYKKLTSRDIWRHEATITDLDSKKIPYQVYLSLA